MIKNIFPVSVINITCIRINNVYLTYVYLQFMSFNLFKVPHFYEKNYSITIFITKYYNIIETGNIIVEIIVKYF